jgi:hypothetical protein
VKRAKVRVALPAEHHLEQMPGIVRKPIDVRVFALQPARQQVNRQRRAIHLGEQRHQEGAEALNELQSRLVWGLKNEKAKKIKTAELIKTSDHKP